MPAAGSRPLAVVLVALATVSLCAVAWHTGPGAPRRAELFDWSRFTAQQDTLRRQASDLTAQLGDDGDGAGRRGLSREVQEKGADIKHALAKLMKGLHPRHARRQQHTYVPMDQELAILKVQKQMHTEHKFAKDRIEGGGDVAAVVNEAEQSDERSALMESPKWGPDTKTENLFENCEDGSLTAEDAELCGRRASAIKMITRAAIRQQLEKNPPVSPNDMAGVLDAEQENKARKDLVAYALIGKQYVALLDEEKKAESETQAERNALLAQGRHVHTQKMHQASVAKYRSPRAPGGRNVKEAKGDLPRKRGRGLAGRRRVHGKLAHGSQDAATPARSAARKSASEAHESAAKPSTRAAAKKVHAPKTVPGSTGGKKKKSAGDLGALQGIADAMPKHLTTPKTDSKTRLADLESAISDTQARLAKEKMRFTKEMLKRQKELQSEFVQSMQQIHAGLSVVDDVGTAGADSDAQPSGRNMLAAEQAAFMQKQRDSVIAAAAAAQGPTLQVTQQMNPVVEEVQREIAASHLFKYPPAPELVSTHKSTEDQEKDTVRAALEEQFDQVASDGSVTPKVRHDKWQDLMTKMSQQVSQDIPWPKPAAAASTVRGKKSGDDTKLAGMKSGKVDKVANLQAGGQRGSSKNKITRENLRLLSSYGFKEGIHTSHIGPASYDALAYAAASDMKSAITNGSPTMEVATTNALKADELAHNPQVFFCFLHPAIVVAMVFLCVFLFTNGRQFDVMAGGAGRRRARLMLYCHAGEGHVLYAAEAAACGNAGTWGDKVGEGADRGAASWRKEANVVTFRK